jgi:HEAT repeat protein
VPALVALQADDDREVAQAAQDSLVALPGPEVDAAIASMLTQADANTRRVAIEQIGQRRAPSAAPALLKAAEDPDETVRAASLKVLGDVAGIAEFPALVGLLVKAKSPAEMKAAEGALSAICIREGQPAAGKVVILAAVYGALPDGPSADVTKKVAELVKAGTTSVEASNSNFGDPANGIAKKLRVEYTVEGRTETKTVGEGDAITFTGRVTPPACTDALCAALAQATAEPKLALLRALRSAGGPKALEAVRAATKDANAEVKNAATSLLCEWPSAEALPDLMQLLKTATTQRDKILALRGIIGLIPLQDAPAEKKLASLKEVLPLAERTEEKRLALAALAAIPTVEALALVTPHLDSPALKEEASQAAVAIAEKIVRAHPAQVAEAMGEVTKVTTNKQLAKRARGLLDQAKKAAPRK